MNNKYSDPSPYESSKTNTNLLSVFTNTKQRALSKITVGEFIDFWLPIHAAKRWQYNTYSASVTCIENHIKPYIGHLRLKSLNPVHIEALFTILHSKRKEIYTGKSDAKRYGSYISSTTIRYVYILLRQFISKAVEWGYLSKSPVLCDPPARDTKEREIWTPEMFEYALDKIDDPLLHLSIHMLFACTLRIGEMLAITHEDIDLQQGYININKTLQRVTTQALSAIPPRSLVKEFPPVLPNSNSRIILKQPKTSSSYRKVYLTQPLTDEIREYLRFLRACKKQNRWSMDHKLLFCLLESGRPIESKLCAKWFEQWQQKHSHMNFPSISFHNIRHSSATYKLILSNGDIKSVQGDTGHKTPEMLLNIYAHIQDSRRKLLAEAFQSDFYNLK